MTPQDTNASDAVASAGLVEAGAPEIEITPAMIEAGDEAIRDRLGGCDLGGHFSASRLAREVYRAMAIAKMTSHSS